MVEKIRLGSLLKYSDGPHAKAAKDAKAAGEGILCGFAAFACGFFNRLLEPVMHFELGGRSGAPKVQTPFDFLALGAGAGPGVGEVFRVERG